MDTPVQGQAGSEGTAPGAAHPQEWNQGWPEADHSSGSSCPRPSLVQTTAAGEASPGSVRVSVPQRGAEAVGACSRSQVRKACSHTEHKGAAAYQGAEGTLECRMCAEAWADVERGTGSQGTRRGHRDPVPNAEERVGTGGPEEEDG